MTDENQNLPDEPSTPAQPESPPAQSQDIIRAPEKPRQVVVKPPEAPQQAAGYQGNRGPGGPGGRGGPGGGRGRGGPGRGGPGGGPGRGGPGGGPGRGGPGGGPGRGGPGGGPGRGGPGGGPGRGGPGGPRGRGGRDDRQTQPGSEDGPEIIEKVVFINRCAKVVKGGRRFSFSALVVVGDQKGRVGMGVGKAKEVPEAIRKGTEQAHKHMIDVKLKGTTIPHEVTGVQDGGRVLLRPATPGTGVIAGGGVRAVLEAVGVKDVLSKMLGSNNSGAVVAATIHALRQLRSAEEIRELRQAS